MPRVIKKALSEIDSWRPFAERLAAERFSRNDFSRALGHHGPRLGSALSLDKLRLIGSRVF
jgi:hypothetical protein